jgi:hypothetical protein
MKYIFLFGHRQQHGKDTCCNILENILKKKKISHARTYFAKLLKKQVSERYNLNFEKMENNDYKLWCPPHIKKKIVRTTEGLTHEVMRTVRDILIEEGCKGREIWENTWANAAYMELFRANPEIGIISDYRYPSEYITFSASFETFEKEYEKIERPIPIRVLVHRPNGVFKTDGADGELPDIDPIAWDYVILNDKSVGWEEHLENQLEDILKKLGV